MTSSTCGSNTRCGVSTRRVRVINGHALPVRFCKRYSNSATALSFRFMGLECNSKGSAIQLVGWATSFTARRSAAIANASASRPAIIGRAVLYNSISDLSLKRLFPRTHKLKGADNLFDIPSGQCLSEPMRNVPPGRKIILVESLRSKTNALGATSRPTRIRTTASSETFSVWDL